MDGLVVMEEKKNSKQTFLCITVVLLSSSQIILERHQNGSDVSSDTRSNVHR